MSASDDLVLLDLDGTLTDSAPGILASVRHAYGVLGLPVPAEPLLRGFVGPPLGESFTAHGVPVDLVADAVAAYRDVYAAGKLLDNAVYPGIPECLTALRGAGLRLAVATSKPEPMARRIVEHFGLGAHLDRGLDDVFGATLDGSRSTKGDVVAHALASLGAPRRAVMVGDREHDVLGAAAHQIPCVGVAWGYARPGELAAAGATVVVGTPAELVTLLLDRELPAA
ncbi:HAD hydrolase-like protein [Cellulosimicrobium cellulans]|uniref:HAD family hydrolase n=1 Tax=Cellulosimicrobium cellulans TaxID=1710 RepID=UPI0019631E78|nr:HAD family hydrolase [Cellulosimicrobium cellulans]MBN0039092.1 HAD hydrolase-like protein [Cellulosimicrobium cellulans]